MLAVLGFLPLDDVIDKPETADQFPSEICYILLTDTITNDDSIVIHIPNLNSLDSAYFNVVKMENNEPITIINSPNSLLPSQEIEYIVLTESFISE